MMSHTNTSNTSESTAVIARGLRKSYGKNEVLTGVDFALEGGQIYGLLGRNGTGKSTLLSLLAGQLKHTAGELQVFGKQPFDNAAVMDEAVYAGIDVPYPPTWSLKKILQIAAARFPHWNAAEEKELIDAFELNPRTRYSKASRGQRSMVGIIIGLAANAPLTLIDEPYLGLDVHNREVFYRALLRSQDANSRTIVMATHDLGESAKVIDHYLLLGRDGTIFMDMDAADVDAAFVTVTASGLPRDVLTHAVHSESMPGQERAVLKREALDALTLPEGAAVHNLPIDEALGVFLGKDWGGGDDV